MLDAAAAKRELRRSVLAARAALPTEVHAAEAAALAAAVGRFSGTVCAYQPVGTEPGSPALLDALRDAGCRVLLPVVTGFEALDWVEHNGSSRPGPVGLLQPDGPRLGTAAVAEATLVLVPALAVGRNGVRVGRGGGHYDRTLPLTAPGTPLVAVVRDTELLDAVAAEPHDVRVTAVLTPGAGLVALS